MILEVLATSHVVDKRPAGSIFSTLQSEGGDLRDHHMLRYQPRTLLSNFAILCMASCCLVATSLGAVANGDFEAGKNVPGFPIPPDAPLTGWLIGEDLGAPPNPSGTNKVEGTGAERFGPLLPKSGDIYVAFSGTATTSNGFGTLSQTLTTDPLKTYNLSFWLANPIDDISNLNNLFAVRWNGALINLSGTNITEVGSSDTYRVTPNTSTWFQITASDLPVTGTSTVLQFLGRNEDWGTLLDVVTVVEVPEPTAAALLGVGAAFLGFARRRGRSV